MSLQKFIKPEEACSFGLLLIERLVSISLTLPLLVPTVKYGANKFSAITLFHLLVPFLYLPCLSRP